MTERIAIYPGTFDPITVGHKDIIRRALNVVDRLVIGVAQDSGKDPMFSLEARTELVKTDIQSFGEDAKRIEVQSFSGLLVNFAREHGSRILIRGMRAVSDYEYEFQMACMNARLDPQMETIFMTASESTHFISSRFVKQIAKLGGDISDFVSPEVAARLDAFF